MKALLLSIFCFAFALVCPAANDANDLSPSEDQKIALERTMSQMRLISHLCLLWAAEHQGKFPSDLTELLTDRYLGRDQAQLLNCPLVKESSAMGYFYYGRAWSESIPDDKVLLLSRWKGPEGLRLVARKDGSVILEKPRTADFFVAGLEAPPKRVAETTPATMPPVEPKKVTPPVATPPVEPKKAAPPVADAPPPAKPPAPPPQITIAGQVAQYGKRDKRYSVSFPASSMPPGRENYLWVMDPPSHVIVTAPLTRETWYVHSTGPGVYRVHLEYRAGLDKRAVSNEVELTVK